MSVWRHWRKGVESAIGLLAIALCVVSVVRGVQNLLLLLHAELVNYVPHHQPHGFPPPAVLFLGNGIELVGCGGGGAGGLEGCEYEKIRFDFTAEDIVKYRDLFLKLPNWAAKAAITTIINQPQCPEGEDARSRRSTQNNPCHAEGDTTLTNRCMCLASFPDIPESPTSAEFRQAVSAETMSQRCGTDTAFHDYADIAQYYSSHPGESILDFAPRTCSDFSIVECVDEVAVRSVEMLTKDNLDGDEADVLDNQADTYWQSFSLDSPSLLAASVTATAVHAVSVLIPTLSEKTVLHQNLTVKLDVHDSADYCASLGAFMWEPVTAAQLRKAAGELIRPSCWVAWNDELEEGVFVSMRGNVLPAGATVWNDGQPNNWNGIEDCAEIQSSTGLLNDVRCSSTKSCTGCTFSNETEMDTAVVRVCSNDSGVPSDCRTCGAVAGVAAAAGEWANVTCPSGGLAGNLVLVEQPAGSMLQVAGLAVIASPCREDVARDACECMRCLNDWCGYEYAACSCSAEDTAECGGYRSCVAGQPESVRQECCPQHDHILPQNGSDERLCEVAKVTDHYRHLINLFSEAETREYCEAVDAIVDSIPQQELTPFVLVMLSGPRSIGLLNASQLRVRLNHNESGVWGLTTHSYSEMRARFMTEDRYERYSLLVDLIDGYSWSFASASLDQTVHMTKTVIREAGTTDKHRMQNQIFFSHADTEGEVRAAVSWQSSLFFVASSSPAFDWLTGAQMLVQMLLMLDRAFQTVQRVLAKPPAPPPATGKAKTPAIKHSASLAVPGGPMGKHPPLSPRNSASKVSPLTAATTSPANAAHQGPMSCQKKGDGMAVPLIPTARPSRRSSKQDDVRTNDLQRVNQQEARPRRPYPRLVRRPSQLRQGGDAGGGGGGGQLRPEVIILDDF